MGIENACNACQSSGDAEGQQLVFCDVDSDGLSGDAVVTDGHDRAAGSGIYKVHDDDQCDQDKNDADREGSCLRGPCDPLRTLDEDFAAVF